ncbi:DUF305 domain-containing protein [Streptomyces sp. NPDC002573]|uniref:DUF305 domain-containing protein n=1 Tax=Streptomyces sp. NPDC002573 TaxID=3364651 RepID=UPI0036CCCAA0
MTSGPRIRLAAGRAHWMLLVLTVVAGVLAMHALSPSGNPSAGAHIMATGPGVAAHHAETTAAHASDAGSMSGADMDKLAKLYGDAFDTAFLRMMVGHHQGVLTMAEAEQAKGAYGPAKAMARSIVTSQSAEITGMNRMLGHS